MTTRTSDTHFSAVRANDIRTAALNRRLRRQAIG